MTITQAFPSASIAAIFDERRFGHVIDGELLTDLGDRPHAVINPSTGNTIVEVPLGTAADVDRAVHAARAASVEWGRRTPAERSIVLLQLADLIDEHAETFAQLESLNVGKPLPMSRDELPVSSDTLRFMAGAVRAQQAPATAEYTQGYVSMVRREPLGVVGAITPWNYPLMTAIWKIAPALAAGNTMVVKPSELTPLTTILFADLAREVLPPGVLNVVVGLGEDVGQALAEHSGVDLISLTGSVASGISVARSGAQTLKGVHLELGGKAPVVVFADADLDAAVDAVGSMGFWNAGQECGAATRLLCERSVRDQFVEALRVAVGTLTVGAPDPDDDKDVGPLISARHRDRVDGLVRNAVEHGATVKAGGQAVEGEGFFYEPTILADVPAVADLARTEVFGPVVTIETFEDEADAIRRANDGDYGLSASVWTENGGRALRMTDALDYGTVWVNTHLALAIEMPWVGFGMSGHGRELSTLALDDFSRTKHVMIAKGQA